MYSVSISLSSFDSKDTVSRLKVFIVSDNVIEILISYILNSLSPKCNYLPLNTCIFR